MVRFFYNLLNQGNPTLDSDREEFLDIIPKVILDEENLAVREPISLEELKKVTYSLNLDKSPRPDGFPASFYQIYWDIIKEVLLGVVEESQ